MPFSLGSVLLAQIIIEYLRIGLIHTKCLKFIGEKKAYSWLLSSE